MTEKNKSPWIDITPPITERLGVFPGDTPFRRNIILDFKQGNNIVLSSVSTTLHLGAHADSSSHYHASGEGVEKRPVDAFIGKAQVIRVSGKTGRIEINEFSTVKIEAPRVLFRTDSFPDTYNWNHDFRSFSPEALGYLADQGVVLVGIDTPSVDPEDSKSLEAHQILYSRNLCVLEGLVLTHVTEGLYTLVAPPLPIVDGDASPVRALLHPNPNIF